MRGGGKIQGVAYVAYPLNRLAKVRQALRSDVRLLAKLGVVPTAEDFTEMAAIYRELLPTGVEFETVRQSLEHRVGVRVTRDNLSADAWLLSGNAPALQAGQVVRPWAIQLTPEWIPVQVVDEALHRTQRGKFGSIFHVRVLAGSSAGQLFETFRTTRFCSWLSQSLGFSKPFKNRPFQRNAEFMNLRFYALAVLNPRGPQPTFDKFYVPPSMVAYNVRLLKVRNRDAEPCPQGYQHHCYLCSLGYDRCVHATHPTTYVRGECVVCKNPQALLDPRKIALGVCTKCDTHQRLSHKK